MSGLTSIGAPAQTEDAGSAEGPQFPEELPRFTIQSGAVFTEPFFRVADRIGARRELAWKA
jgi:hypothetical protein